jgi:hypothetical protein
MPTGGIITILAYTRKECKATGQGNAVIKTPHRMLRQNKA